MKTIDIKASMLKHLDDVLAEWKRLTTIYRPPEYKDMGGREGTRFVTRALAVVDRISGRGSAYAKQAHAIVDQRGYVGYVARHIVGVVESLRDDVEGDFFDDFAELIHGDVFGDFLEMAQYLVEEAYKDAAAVIAGSSLEAHLRLLCAKNGVDVEQKTASAIRLKKAEQMNSDLASVNAYSKLDQKNVTAWLDLRNKAAHGLYSEYGEAQVRLMVSGILDFIARKSA